MRSSGRLPGWLKDERGSFTLESVFVFPVMLALVLSFIVMGLYFYQNVIVYYSASVVAESAAFNWDNSHRDVRTGMLEKPVYDGLYWRLGTDGAIGSMLGASWRGEFYTIALPAADDSGTGGHLAESLTGRKLLLAAGWLQEAELAYEGQIRLTNKGASRYVEVGLTKPLSLLPWEPGRTRGDPAAAAAGYIAEPVEFIRTVDLLRYYAERLAAAPGGKAEGQSRAAKVLAAYGSRQ